MFGLTVWPAWFSMSCAVVGLREDFLDLGICSQVPLWLPGVTSLPTVSSTKLFELLPALDGMFSLLFSVLLGAALLANKKKRLILLRLYQRDSD